METRTLIIDVKISNGEIMQYYYSMVKPMVMNDLYIEAIRIYNMVNKYETCNEYFKQYYDIVTMLKKKWEIHPYNKEHPERKG